MTICGACVHPPKPTNIRKIDIDNRFGLPFLFQTCRIDGIVYISLSFHEMTVCSHRTSIVWRVTKVERCSIKSRDTQYHFEWKPNEKEKRASTLIPNVCASLYFYYHSICFIAMNIIQMWLHEQEGMKKWNSESVQYRKFH